MAGALDARQLPIGGRIAARKHGHARMGKKDAIVGLVILIILIVSYAHVREKRRIESEEGRMQCMKESYERADYYGGTQDENYRLCLEERSAAGATDPRD